MVYNNAKRRKDDGMQRFDCRHEPGGDVRAFIIPYRRGERIAHFLAEADGDAHIAQNLAGCILQNEIVMHGAAVCGGGVFIRHIAKAEAHGEEQYT